MNCSDKVLNFLSNESSRASAVSEKVSSRFIRWFNVALVYLSWLRSSVITSSKWRVISCDLCMPDNNRWENWIMSALNLACSEVASSNIFPMVNFKTIDQNLLNTVRSRLRFSSGGAPVAIMSCSFVCRVINSSKLFCNPSGSFISPRSMLFAIGCSGIGSGAESLRSRIALISFWS